ncbi:hypothetical protein GX50_05081 [[Emmonsia] crescens]|uniref:Uncharacterized protein n=1 Tax=[Emmonsia] crescens TaxID=73230 RepID=A0A2B7ZFK3_9EURO|nr:hypothetical protein GX50_05081 [Emmonsia crescens]
MSWATALTTTAYYTIYPATIIATLLLAVLRTLATPFIHVAIYIFHICILLPLRFLLKFEPLYIFLSVAGVLGVSAGISLHFLSGYMHQLLDIGVESEYSNEYKAKNKIVDGNRTSSLTNPTLRYSDTKKYATTASGRPNLKAFMKAWEGPHQSGNGAGNVKEERTGMRALWRLPAFTKEQVGMYPANVWGSENVKMQGKGKGKGKGKGRERGKWPEDENDNESGSGGGSRSRNGRVVKRERDREDLFATMILEEDDDDDDDDDKEEDEED